MIFRDFFFALHGKTPFHWQERLADEVAAGRWPDVLALPTASGKTACVDVAVFAMVRQAGFGRAQRTAPRRVFFVVDRRVIVDEVYERMKRVRCVLCNAKDGVLKEAADALRELAGGRGAEPIIAYQMRGGVYRDYAWVRNPAQPALIASTVDQTGSRLLFQGYGVSASAKPIHAALVANDALIILDEAHCSVPFGQTLDSVKRFRETGGIAEELRMPFHVVMMSATPGDAAGKSVFTLPEEDGAEDRLGRRLRATKPTRLVLLKESSRDAVEQKLSEKAIELVEKDAGLKNIVVFVNRVASARAVFQRLQQANRQAELMIGRMRPIDRDLITTTLQPRLKSGARRPSPDDKPLFVVATQCLEVGADYDFDALVTECASIDALRQRFGRLNRLGRDNVQAKAVIVIPGGRLTGDAVYGDAIDHTWGWLKRLAGEGEPVDFANEGPGTVGESLPRQGPELSQMQRQETDAPVMFREYLDIWSQTNPAPDPQPDPGYFLHGKEFESDDVQVVWRADLEGPGSWIDIVSLCPPSSAEAMPVSLRRLRGWMSNRKEVPVEADIAQVAGKNGDRPGATPARKFLVWRGTRDSEIRRYPNQIRAGDTVVLPVSYGGWNELGHVPDGFGIDRAEEALFQAKRRVCLRVHPALTGTWTETPGKEQLLKAVESGDRAEIRDAFDRYYDELAEGQWPRAMIQPLRKGRFTTAEYPERKGVVLRSKGRFAEEDDGDDGLSLIDREISLRDHTRHVRDWCVHFVEKLGLEELKGALTKSAEMHDWGKADVRFQALLRGGDRWKAQLSPALLAKSENSSISFGERKRQRKLSGLPEHFRHEFLSLQLAESNKCGFEEDRDLVLHLIAAHHGWARPFGPVVFDDELPAVSLAAAGIEKRWSKEERAGMFPSHRIGSGVGDRFWRLNRRLGWWGLAYVEAIFRLADWSASEEGEVIRQAEDEAA